MLTDFQELRKIYKLGAVNIPVPVLRVFLLKTAISFLKESLYVETWLIQSGFFKANFSQLTLMKGDLLHLKEHQKYIWYTLQTRIYLHSHKKKYLFSFADIMISEWITEGNDI